MSRQVLELETILQQLANEHEKLLKHVDAHQSAMRSLDLRAMDDATQRQEATRLRIGSLEGRRRNVAAQVALALRLDGPPTISAIATAMPAMRERLTRVGERLRELVTQVQSRVSVGGRLAGAVLGHLNTVVRLVAGAVEQTGVYTREGVPRVAARIGVMEAVG